MGWERGLYIGIDKAYSLLFFSWSQFLEEIDS